MSDQIITFPQWISDYCESHAEPVIRDSGKMITYCLELDQMLPKKYGWRFSDVESIKNQLDDLKSPKEINKTYWLDQSRNIEAYSIMTSWRGLELLKSVIRSLNVHEVITPAVLVRSLLELACVFIINSNTLDKIFREIDFSDKKIVISQELEEMIVKMIWGTRVGDPAPYLKQTNILTYIQKVSKNPNAKDVLHIYEYLCDVAHPSFIGNTRFWSHVEEVFPDGSQRRVIAKFADKECTREILDKILWGLGWSSVVLRNGFENTREAIQQILTKIENG